MHNATHWVVSFFFIKIVNLGLLSFLPIKIKLITEKLFGFKFDFFGKIP